MTPIRLRTSPFRGESNSDGRALQADGRMTILKATARRSQRWENRRASQRTSDAIQSDTYSNNNHTVDDGLYSIAIEDHEDFVSYNRTLLVDNRSSDFVSTTPISRTQEELVDDRYTRQEVSRVFAFTPKPRMLPYSTFETTCERCEISSYRDSSAQAERYRESPFDAAQCADHFAVPVEN